MKKKDLRDLFNKETNKQFNVLISDYIDWMENKIIELENQKPKKDKHVLQHYNI